MIWHLIWLRILHDSSSAGPPALETDQVLLGRFLGSLPFGLTGAQQRVITELQQDLARPHPMARLVQGDVGSGKTVVAALAAAAPWDAPVTERAAVLNRAAGVVFLSLAVRLALAER
mgnify:CR=1 FL=1